MGRRGYRRRKGFGIEGIAFLVAISIVVLVGLLALLKHVLFNLLSLLNGLTFLEWLYTALFCVFLYFLYHISTVREKKVLEWNKKEQEQREEQYRIKQLEKIKSKNQLDEIKKMHHFEFETFIKELFELMGYKATLTSKTGDGGKDIILNKGNDVMLVECKRYNATKVTRPDIQKFHSAMIDMKAKKGFFITTGEFTKTSIEYAKDKYIELINGDQLIILIQKTTSESLNNNTGGKVKKSQQINNNLLLP